LGLDDLIDFLKEKVGSKDKKEEKEKEDEETEWHK